jgi:GNAT superfamily N-acetyltransferase
MTLPHAKLEPPLILRAVGSDADALTAIALAAKRHWGYPAAWMETWRAALTITAEYIAAEPVYVARCGGADEPGGFYGLLGKDGAIWLEHLWVLPARMGAGIGGALLRHACETAAAEGASALEIEADPHAVAFYVRSGARQVGERMSAIAGQPRILPLLRIDLSC